MPTDCLGDGAGQEMQGQGEMEQGRWGRGRWGRGTGPCAAQELGRVRGREGSTASLPKADSLLAVQKNLAAFPDLEVKSSAGDIER